MSTRFYNIKEAKLGATNITTVASIDLRQSQAMLTDRGDNDQFDSWIARGPGSTGVTINLRDPQQAASLAAEAAVAALTFKGVPENGGTEKLVTITGVLLGSPSFSAPHGAAWSCSISGVAFKSDGTNPVTIADVVG